MTTWTGAPEPRVERLGPRDWLRLLRRGLPMAVVVFGLAVPQRLLRLIEAAVHGENRPWTPHFTRLAMRTALRLMGLPLTVRGTPMQGPGALVANHSTWLDIFTLNATDLVYFVSKSEVARWPGIGWLARGVGTVFIARDRKEAAAQTRLLERRLLAGHRLLFFPEGTSTDNQRVLPFKTTLFQAFFSPALHDVLQVQPVSLTYHAPEGADPAHYGWWGDMDFASNLLVQLATPRHGRVEIVLHPPLRVADFPDRKALARACEHAVRRGHAAPGM